MAFSDQLFSNMFPAQKMQELEELNRKAYGELANDMVDIKEKLEEHRLYIRQLGIMFKTFYDLALEKGLFNEKEFKDLLDKIDLSEWV